MMSLWAVTFERGQFRMKHPLTGERQLVRMVNLRRMLSDELIVMFPKLSPRQRRLSLDGFFRELFITMTGGKP
jgi:hypothetical protein